RQAQAVEAQVLVELKTAYQELAGTRELVQSIERELLGPAEQARNTAAYVYRSGASTLVELLDAQRAFNDTMQSYYQAQAAYRRALVRVNGAVGREVAP